MMQRYSDGSKKIERKTIEKNRRTHMKKLCVKLNSLIPSLFSQPFKLITQDSQFDHSIAYIEQLRKRIEVLKDKRDEALRSANDDTESNRCCNVKDNQSIVSCDSVSPSSTVEVQELDGGLKVILISSSRRKILFSKIYSIVEDGGAEVVKGGYTTVGDKVIYTLHAKARVTRIGIEVTSVHQKLLELMNRSS
ncbi:hypothetical protein L1987_53582 [Smallanthus sonchifolius]|uniref:Uncharacterized protein n=1 Tax=Smallanthus sonchifolius TaxID=185202 RepID=A0ACB9EWB9_9ASTR|nr:hypothetical protein L1987_53582 [Smallanthus sonchifolius]